MAPTPPRGRDDPNGRGDISGHRRQSQKLGGSRQQLPDAVRKRAVETWLRRRGLPMAVRHDRSALQRSVPAMVFLLLLDAAVFADNLVFGVDDGAGTIILAAFLLSPLIAWLAARMLRHASPRTRRVATWTVFALYLVVDPAVAKFIGSESPWWYTFWTWVYALVVTGIVAVGAVSIFVWALRIALRRFAGFADLASRALPLLMLFTLFGLFTQEIWQAFDALAHQGVWRNKLWLVIVFFAVLTSLFLISVLRAEALAMIERLRSVELSEYMPQLRDTPLDGLDCRPGAQRPLSWREKLNLGLVLYLGQALQTIVFSVVVFVFFILLGRIAIDRTVIEKWVPHATPGKLLRFQLPEWLGIYDELIKVSLFLAAFSGMYFAAHMAREEIYRSRYFEPLVTEVATTLAGRDIYLALWHDRSSAEQPSPAPNPSASTPAPPEVVPERAIRHPGTTMRHGEP